MTDKTAPESRLQLEWVYGYRGHQCRNNLFYTATGEVVYFVAGAGVVYNTAEKKQRFYLGHNDDILSLALHPDKTLVATAQLGKAPFICVWDTVTLDTISILQGSHERGIAALGFSSDGKLLASVGLDDYHTLNIWDWKRGKVMASARGHGDRLFDVQFSPVPNPNITLVTCGVKHIKFWSLCGNTLSGKKGIFGKKGELQSILCAAFSSTGEAYTGTLSGDVYKWTGHTLHSVIKGAHNGAIYSMYVCADGYATGSKDGTVRLWDNDFKPITKLNLGTSSSGYKGLVVRSVCWNGEHVLAGTKGSEVFEISVQDQTSPAMLVGGHSEGELWGLATHPLDNVFATASDDKTIKIWNLSERHLMISSQTPHPVRSIAISPDGSLLAAGMNDGSFSVYSTNDLTLLHNAKNRKEVLHEMKFSPDGKYLAVGSNDNFVDVYQVGSGFKRVGQCSGSSSFITHLDWSVDSKYLQTNSGASERLFYQMPGGKRITGKEEIQAIHWSSWTCVLGTEVNGIWPKYTQVNDVNATDTSFDDQTIVTGDDFGLVKLFRFPCIKKGAKFKKYVGHCAHVTNVRFTHDKRHVISVGGADNTIFQWKFIRAEGEEEEGEESGCGQVGGDSDSEASDSEMSDVGSLDSDLEREQEKSYERPVYREDLQVLKKAISKREKEAPEVGGVKSQRSGAHGKKATVPDNSLAMEFIHGYRGYDCRQNLYYTKEGHILYHIAAVGVVYDKANHTQSFYTAHTDDILCLEPHPSFDLVATGQIGRDPSVHVWDVKTMETQSILKGEHSRGVCALGFSGDGKRLASVGLDDDHCIVVWEWRKGEKLATTRGHKDKIFYLAWNPLTSDQMVTVGVKHIKFWTQTGGGFTSKRGVFGKVGKPVSMLSVTYGTTPDLCYSGGADGRVYHWRVSTLIKTVEAHKGPVYALRRVEKGYISGGKDGIVCLWDESLGSCLKTYQLHSSAIEGGGVLHSDLPPIRALVLAHGKILVGTKNSEILEVDRSGPIQLLIQGHQEGELWGLATHPNQPLAVTASDDGTVRVWSLNEHKLVKVCHEGKPARCVGYSHDGEAMAVGFKDGSFKVLDSDLKELASFQHRKEEISDVKFSPNGKYLAVGSHDNFVDIYSLVKQKRVGICKGPSSYITHVDWDTRGKLLQVNTGDSEVLYFEAPRGKQQFINREDAEDITWATWTSVLGPSVQGVWPAYTDVTDVNAACVSHDGEVISTGDDFGFVKLFKYPSYGKHAKCRQYPGHSAHVTNVRFSSDDEKLVSTGGADTAVVVWKHQGGTRGQSEDQSDPALPVSSSSSSSGGLVDEESDTDSEEEGGYDSDVEREKNMDYSSKTYTAPVRDASAETRQKPHQQVEEASQRAKVSRSTSSTTKVVTKEEKTQVEDLALDYVFGYRGFDTRQNVHLTPDGGVVYHAAGAGVVFNPLTKTQSFYLEHNDDIVCLALCRNAKLGHVVASGQIGPSAPIHVWDSHSKQTLSLLHGAHGVGVCSVDFSFNGKLLLSVGLDENHSITIWRWTEGTKVAQAAGDQRRIFIAQFRPDSTTKFVSCGVKHVRFWNLVGTQLVNKKGNIPKTLDVSMQTMLSLAFAPDDVTFTGAVNGDVYVWQTNILLRVISQAHSGPVMAMYTCLDDGLVLSAGKERDGENDSGVKLWGVDMNRSRSFPLGDHKGVVKAICRSKGKIVVGTQNSEVLEIDEKTGALQVLVQGHREGELWGLATHPSSLQFITASDDKTVRLWDLKTKSIVCQRRLPNGARSADISPDGTLAVVGQTSGEFVVLSMSDFSIVRQKRDRSKTLQVVRFSPSGQSIAVGSDDACVDIYSTCNLTRTSGCRGIPSSVTHIDWSQDGVYLQVSTHAYQRLVFQASSGKLISEKADIAKIVWASWTSVLGREVVGIWPKNVDRGDVNTSHLNHSGTALATGDDFGCVKLFDHFPLSDKFAQHRKYFGHSAHVTNVKFTYDDSYLVSLGGDDSCVFIWKCC